MKLRPLIIDAAAREAVHQVVDHAAKPENWYQPGPGVVPPGDHPGFVVHLNTYRCVFSLTEDVETKALFRHLSISVPEQDKLPNLEAVNTIGQLFGFPNLSSSLHADVALSRMENCVVMAHPIMLETL